MDKTTLKAIFVANGLDPFDAFLMDRSEWPQEAQDLVNQPAQPKPQAASYRTEWEARTGRDGAE